MNILCVLGEHAYGDPGRGEGYEFVNFLPAFRRLGHRVSLFESFSREPYADFAMLNRALLRRVEETTPDVVFCVLMQYEVWTETLHMIRNCGPALVNWATDDSWKYRMFTRLIASEFDLLVTTYPDILPRYRRDGIHHVHLSQWAANADRLLPPLPAADCRYEVSFVGAAYGHRRLMIESLRREGVDVTCFGYGWPAGPIPTTQVSAIIRQSRVSLNFSEGSRETRDPATRQIKARVFEVPGYGGCLLTEHAPNLERYFVVGEEICSFDGAGGLVDAVKALLARPEQRDEIAHRGFARVSREHTYDQRFSAMLDDMKQRVGHRPSAAVRWSEFDAAARQHRMNLPLRLLRSLLIFCANIIWGRQRGPRAARRAVFELSWRLCGARTYAAAGWPGRMFYRES